MSSATAAYNSSESIYNSPAAFFRLVALFTQRVREYFHILLSTLNCFPAKSEMSRSISLRVHMLIMELELELITVSLSWRALQMHCFRPAHAQVPDQLFYMYACATSFRDTHARRTRRTPTPPLIHLILETAKLQQGSKH